MIATVAGVALVHAERGWQGRVVAGMGLGMGLSMGLGAGMDPGARMGPRMGMAGGIAAMLEPFDRDGDGSVSQAEVEAQRTLRLARFEANDAGVLDRDAFEALWLEAMRPRMVRGFQALDVDGDATSRSAG